MKHDLLVAVLGVALLATVASLRAQQAPAGGGRAGAIPGNSGAEPCANSPICGWGLERNLITHELRTADMGFTFAYPFALPEGGGGVSAVAINSKGHLYAFQRNAEGRPQLFEFDQNHTLIRSIGDEVIGHQNKAHGMAVDAEDNVWICDENGDTVMKLSPEGRLLMTIGVRGQRGDWDEARGQRLLWQPLHLAFAPNGDIYIGEGHANESPNDTNKSPTNKSGAARVLHLDKNGRFINQWFGNHAGQGHFSMVHGIAINPDNGNVYIGDREDTGWLSTTRAERSSRRFRCETSPVRSTSIRASSCGWRPARTARSSRSTGKAKCSARSATDPAGERGSSSSPATWRWTRRATFTPAIPASAESPRWCRRSGGRGIYRAERAPRGRSAVCANAVAAR